MFISLLALFIIMILAPSNDGLILTTDRIFCALGHRTILIKKYLRTSTITSSSTEELRNGQVTGEGAN